MRDRRYSRARCLLIALTFASCTAATKGGDGGADLAAADITTSDADSSADALSFDLPFAPRGVSTVAGSGIKGFAEGSAKAAAFDWPAAVAVGPRGELYIADSVNHRIRLYENGRVSTFAGAGVGGLLDGDSKSARFNRPEGVAVDPLGRVVVADRLNNVIRRIDAGRVTTIAGSGTGGFADGQAKSAQFNWPLGVAVLGEKVYVADGSNHRVRLIEGARVKTFAGDGTAGYRDGLATQARFNSPCGIAAAQNQVVIGDRDNHRLRIIKDGRVKTLAGSGAPGFKDGLSQSAQFNAPCGVATNGQLTVVADRFNHRIRALEAGGLVKTIAGQESSGFKDGLSSARFDQPRAVALFFGRIYVADTENHRIRLVVP